MNSSEQRNHKRVTDALANDVAVIAEATADRLVALDKAIGDERTHRIELAKQQRSYVDRQDLIIENRVRAAESAFKAFRDLGFWPRVNWLLTGRLP